MRKRSLRVSVVVVAFVVVQAFALTLAEATHVSTKRTDPIVQVVKLFNSTLTGHGFYQLYVEDITAEFACCPKPDTDQSCRKPAQGHIQDAQTLTFSFDPDAPEGCKNGAICNFKSPLKTDRQFADVFQAQFCPGKQVIPTVPRVNSEGVIEFVPLYAWHAASLLLVGVDCLDDPTCTCALGACPIFDCFSADFTYFFTLAGLPMEGNDKGVDTFFSPATCPCVNCSGGFFVK